MTLPARVKLNWDVFLRFFYYSIIRFPEVMYLYDKEYMFYPSGAPSFVYAWDAYTKLCTSIPLKPTAASAPKQTF